MLVNRVIGFGSAVVLVATATLWSQGQGAAGKQALQQRIAELKQSMAENRAKLKKYQWVETTEVSLKGEVKKREQKQCVYGPDGKVQKTPIGQAGGGGSTKPTGRLKGRIVEKKTDELKDYMERVGALVSRYVPPDPQKMQASFEAGKGNLDLASAGIASLIFSDYAKPGDKVNFAFNRAAKKLQSYNVNTYLDSPQDIVTLTAEFSSLPDGTNYVAHTVLNATGKQIQVNTTNSGYTPIGQ
jgi:hypothetical protein